MTSTGDEDLWRALMARKGADGAACEELVCSTSDRVAVLRRELTAGGQSAAMPLRLLGELPVEARLLLFEQVLWLSSWAHSTYHLAHAAIRALPREWVLEHIEDAAEPLLEGGDPEEHWRLLELFDDLDPALCRRFATRCAAHADPDIREAGGDFLEVLEARQKDTTP